MRNKQFEIYQRKLKRAQDQLDELDRRYGRNILPEEIFMNFHRACEEVGKCGRDIYRYSTIPNREKFENSKIINHETFPVRFNYRDEDHFSFLLPKLVHKKYGSLSSFFNSAVSEQITEYSRKYRLSRKQCRIVMLEHYDMCSSRSIDFDNAEKTRLINTLVNTILSDDRKESYTLIDRLVQVDRPEDEKCIIHVLKEEDLNITRPNLSTDDFI